MNQPTSIPSQSKPHPESRHGTRDRILDAAGELFRRQGYAATGIKAILSASSAPYGSLYHFFPGGKEELSVAVLEIGGRTYRELVESFYPPASDVAEATSELFAGAAELVEVTGYADACPIATIALEVANHNEPMRIAAAEAFESWLTVLADRFHSAGVALDRARELAVELFCAIEGAFLLSRTIRSAEPLRVAGRAATAAVRHALVEGR